MPRVPTSRWTTHHPPPSSAETWTALCGLPQGKLLTLPLSTPHDADKGVDILLDGFLMFIDITLSTLVKTVIYFVHSIWLQNPLLLPALSS